MPPRRSSLAPCSVPRESPGYPGFCRCGHPMAEHRAGGPLPPSMLGAELPGAPLVLTVDAGGERWTLDGAPLHGGDGIDLLAEGDREPCEDCHEEGTVEAGAQRRSCPACAGRGYLFIALWLPVRFEYRNDGDGNGPAFLYLRLACGGVDVRQAIEVRKGDRLRCRRRAGSVG